MLKRISKAYILRCPPKQGDKLTLRIIEESAMSPTFNLTFSSMRARYPTRLQIKAHASNSRKTWVRTILEAGSIDMLKLLIFLSQLYNFAPVHTFVGSHVRRLLSSCSFPLSPSMPSYPPSISESETEEICAICDQWLSAYCVYS